MKTNRIGPEQLIKILISEIEEIRNLNNSFKISLKDFTTLIDKKLESPIRIDSVSLEQNISKLDLLTEKNEKNNDRFIIDFDNSIEKGKKIFFWTPYILGLVTVICFISFYFNYKLYSQNEKLSRKQSSFYQFFRQNEKANQMYLDWAPK